MLDDVTARAELIAVIILVLGVVLARLTSAAVGGILGFLERRTARLSTTETGVITPNLVRISRAIVFWLIIILAISYSLRILGVAGITSIVSAVIDFIPHLLVALMIVVAGHIAGLIASQLVVNLGQGMTGSSVGPRLLYGLILMVAIVMGLQHINVDISFVTQLTLILVALIGGGLMLAFALGARQLVANLLAQRELTRLAMGDRIRVDGVEGEIVEIHATGLDISTDDGVVSLPGARLAETHVLHLARDDQGE